jgi:hypothetical protein
VAWQWQDGSGDILTIKYFLKKVWHGSGTGGSGKIIKYFNQFLW